MVYKLWSCVARDASMVEINLLPWRAIAHAENIKKRKLFIYSFGILLFLWLVSTILLGQVLQAYDSRISDLKNQLTELNSQTEQNHSNEVLPILEQIHASQYELIHFFKAVEKEVQGMVDWSAIITQKNHIVVTGNIDSVSMLTRFVQTYNSENKTQPMLIMNVKNDSISYAALFRLQLVRLILPFVNQLKNDGIS